MILAIDPGNIDSAYVLAGEDLKPVRFGKVPNQEMLEIVTVGGYDELAIEMIASYGMAVGAEVFETCVWIGRFMEAGRSAGRIERVFRSEVKLNLCKTMKAGDPNIRQALIDRFGDVGVKKKPGWFYGFRADIWAAYAVLTTYCDTMREKA